MNFKLTKSASYWNVRPDWHSTPINTGPSLYVPNMLAAWGASFIIIIDEKNENGNNVNKYDLTTN